MNSKKEEIEKKIIIFSTFVLLIHLVLNFILAKWTGKELIFAIIYLIILLYLLLILLLSILVYKTNFKNQKKHIAVCYIIIVGLLFFLLKLEKTYILLLGHFFIVIYFFPKMDYFYKNKSIGVINNKRHLKNMDSVEIDYDLYFEISQVLDVSISLIMKLSESNSEVIDEVVEFKKIIDIKQDEQHKLIITKDDFNNLIMILIKIDNLLGLLPSKELREFSNSDKYPLFISVFKEFELDHG